MFLSGITFRNNHAAVASIMFTEASHFEPLNCAPVACDTTVNNTAKGGRQLIATPPTKIAVNMSATMRSGAQLPISLRLIDGCARRARISACINVRIMMCVSCSCCSLFCCCCCCCRAPQLRSGAEGMA